VRGDVIEIFPTYDDFAFRITMWGDEIESLEQIDPLTGQVKQIYLRLVVYPKTLYVMSDQTATMLAQYRKRTAVVEGRAGQRRQAALRRSASGRERCSIWR